MGGPPLPPPDELFKKFDEDKNDSLSREEFDKTGRVRQGAVTAPATRRDHRHDLTAAVPMAHRHAMAKARA